MISMHKCAPAVGRNGPNGARGTGGKATTTGRAEWTESHQQHQTASWSPPPVPSGRDRAAMPRRRACRRHRSRSVRMDGAPGLQPRVHAPVPRRPGMPSLDARERARSFDLYLSRWPLRVCRAVWARGGRVACSAALTDRREALSTRDEPPRSAPAGRIIAKQVQTQNAVTSFCVVFQFHAAQQHIGSGAEGHGGSRSR